MIPFSSGLKQLQSILLHYRARADCSAVVSNNNLYFADYPREPRSWLCCTTSSAGRAHIAHSTPREKDGATGTNLQGNLGGKMWKDEGRQACGLVAMGKLGCPVLRGVDISGEHHGMGDKERVLGRESDARIRQKRKGRSETSERTYACATVV